MLTAEASDNHALPALSTKTTSMPTTKGQTTDPAAALAGHPSAASASTRLATLAQKIKDNANLLAASLLTKDLDFPSPGHIQGPAHFPLDSLDPHEKMARDSILSLTTELHDLLVGPRDTLMNHAWNSVSYSALHAVSDFHIAHAVPIGNAATISYTHLAARVRCLTGVDLLVANLKAIVRLAIANGLFTEPEPDHVAHNRASLLLVQDPGVASWVALFTTDLLRPLANAVEAMRRWPASQESNQTGVNIAYNHDMPFFQFLQSDPERLRRYGLAMESHGDRDGFDLSHTVDEYPWSELGEATVVDVGGCQGHVSFTLAKAHPKLSFIVQDKPEMRTPEAIGTVPGNLVSHVKLTTHDCFSPQPVTADAYLFRHVLHTFSDKYAVAALRALIPALRPGARIIINDYVLPRPGLLSSSEEKSVRTMDLLMRVVCNAREREEDDWRDLFAQADARYQWKGVTKTLGKLSFVEAVWTENEVL